MIFWRDHVGFSAANAEWDRRLTRVFGEAGAHIDSRFARLIEITAAGT